MKEFDRAVTSLRKANTLAPNSTQILSALGFAESFVGNMQEAKRIERTLLEKAKHKYVLPQDLAIISLGLGKKDQALVHLEQAYDERGPWMPFIGLDPLFGTLNGHPRFQALLRKVGLPL
jgi:serine/threonine-protein kinase